MTLGQLWFRIKDWWSGKPVRIDRGGLRSDRWPTVRKHHLQKEPTCQWCGGKDHLEVHHEMPFHLDPTKELDDANLITLCEKPGENCHLIHGHNGNWKTYAPDVRKQCEEHRKLTKDVPVPKSFWNWVRHPIDSGLDYIMNHGRINGDM
jgi:hypothetical protein